MARARTRWVFGTKDPQTPQELPKPLPIPLTVLLTADAKKFGLENFGNTCYANSVIQALYFCAPFRDLLLQSSDPSISHLPPSPPPLPPQPTPQQPPPPPTPIREKPLRKYSQSNAPPDPPPAPPAAPVPSIPSSPPTLLSALRSLFFYISSHPAERGTVSPRAFISKLKEVNTLFDSTMHQDAHEFLNYLLNRIVEEIEELPRPGDTAADDLSNSIVTLASKAPTTSSNPRSAPHDPTLVHRLFEGVLTSETRCLTCETVSSRDESFLDLSIDIEQNSSVTACLRQFSASEMLCQKNKFFCDSCCDLQEAEKRMKIKKLPNVLALHLKRFKYQEDVQKYIKLAYRVAFPFELRLFNTVDEMDNADRMYNLFGIVVHIGNGPHHGHYVAVVKTLGVWLLFDDDNITPVPEHEITKYFGDSPSGSAYVLYYQAADIDLEGLGIVREKVGEKVAEMKADAALALEKEKESGESGSARKSVEDGEEAQAHVFVRNGDVPLTVPPGLLPGQGKTGGNSSDLSLEAYENPVALPGSSDPQAALVSSGLVNGTAVEAGPTLPIPIPIPNPGATSPHSDPTGTSPASSGGKVGALFKSIRKSPSMALNLVEGKKPEMRRGEGGRSPGGGGPSLGLGLGGEGRRLGTGAGAGSGGQGRRSVGSASDGSGRRSVGDRLSMIADADMVQVASPSIFGGAPVGSSTAVASPPPPPPPPAIANVNGDIDHPNLASVPALVTPAKDEEGERESADAASDVWERSGAEKDQRRENGAKKTSGWFGKRKSLRFGKESLKALTGADGGGSSGFGDTRSLLHGHGHGHGHARDSGDQQQPPSAASSSSSSWFRSSMQKQRRPKDADGPELRDTDSLHNGVVPALPSPSPHLAPPVSVSALPPPPPPAAEQEHNAQRQRHHPHHHQHYHQNGNGNGNGSGYDSPASSSESTPTHEPSTTSVPPPPRIQSSLSTGSTSTSSNTYAFPGPGHVSHPPVRKSSLKAGRQPQQQQQQARPIGGSPDRKKSTPVFPSFIRDEAGEGNGDVGVGAGVRRTATATGRPTTAGAAVGGGGGSRSGAEGWVRPLPPPPTTTTTTSAALPDAGAPGHRRHANGGSNGSASSGNGLDRGPEAGEGAHIAHGTSTSTSAGRRVAGDSDTGSVVNLGVGVKGAKRKLSLTSPILGFGHKEREKEKERRREREREKAAPTSFIRF